MSNNSLTSLDINRNDSYQRRIPSFNTNRGSEGGFETALTNSTQTANRREDTALKDKCIEMESFLWKQVLNEMKKTINKNKLLDGGQAEDIFTDFLYDEYAMMMAKNGHSGLADTMYKQLTGNYQ